MSFTSQRTRHGLANNPCMLFVTSRGPHEASRATYSCVQTGFGGGAAGAAAEGPRSGSPRPRSGKFWPLGPPDPRFLIDFRDSNPGPRDLQASTLPLDQRRTILAAILKHVLFCLEFFSNFQAKTKVVGSNPGRSFVF